MSEKQVEKQIYNGWAFTANEGEKGRINREIHDELNEKYKIYRHDFKFTPDVDLDQYDVVIGREPGYAHSKYNVIKNTPNLTTDELLLICDCGNLCFGGSSITSNQLRVSED